MARALAPLADLPPWLRDAADPESVADALIVAIPELASGGLALVECAVRRIRLQGGAWVGTYIIDVAEPGSAVISRHTLRVEVAPPGRPAPTAHDGPVPPLGSETWSVVLPDLRVKLTTGRSDETLPALSALTMPEEARALLERAIRRCSPRYSDLRIESSTPEVMRHKPGSRCTVRYRLGLPAEPPPDWPGAVVAKTWHGTKGTNAYLAMQALWQSRLGQSAIVRIAEPLAFLPEENVLVQRAVQESHTFEDLLRSLPPPSDPRHETAVARVRDTVVKVAVGLAELHLCGVGRGETVTWEDELAEIRDRVERLVAAIPPIQGALDPLLEALVERSADHPADAAGPAHRSFRPAQVLLHGDEIAFIDFDGFCQAEPALDVALFLTMMREKGLRSAATPDESPAPGGPSGPGVADGLCEEFLGAYEAVAPISRARVALWEALDLLTAVLGCWTKAKPERLDLRMALLLRHVERMELS